MPQCTVSIDNFLPFKGRYLINLFGRAERDGFSRGVELLLI